MHQPKQIRFAALAFFLAFSATLPQAKADTILNFQFTTAQLESAIQNNSSNYTGYDESAYYAVFLRVASVPSSQYTYNSETAPVDASNNVQFTAGTYTSHSSDQTDYPQPEGSSCSGSSCDTNQYIVFSKGADVGSNSSVMLIGNAGLTAVADLVGSGTVGANGAAPVYWGSQAQTIGGLYANSALFKFSLDYTGSQSLTTVDVIGYVSAIEKGIVGYKRTPGIEINMEFGLANGSFSPVAEPPAGLLVCLALVSIAALKAFQRRGIAK